MEKNKKQESIENTLEHKSKVFAFMETVCTEFVKRAAAHDQSKLSKEEAPHYAKAIDLKGVTYGSKEYFDEVKKVLAPALDHHYKNNRHHPEFHKNGFQDMTWMDKIEMLVDWKAATMRHADGDIKKSMEINQERFGYSDEQKEEMIQFLKDVKLW